MDRRKRAIDAYRRERDGGARERSDEAAEPAAPTDAPGSQEPAQSNGSGAPWEPSASAPAAPDGFVRTTTRTAGEVSELLRGTGAQKAARLIMALRSDEAAAILRLLDPAEVEAITAAIIGVGPVRRSELDEALAEEMRSTRGAPVRGGPQAAREMLVAAFGPDEGERRFFRAVPNAPAHHFAFLNDLEPTQLHALVKDESPAAAALILAHVERGLAANVVQRLPESARGDVARRIARMGKLSRDVIVRVEEAIREKLRVQGRQVTRGVDGPATLAAILRHMAPGTGDVLLGALGGSDSELGRSIRQKLYTTELLLDLSERHLADLLREFTDREVALFMKGKDEPLRASILRALSERRASSVSEEYAHLGARTRADVDRVTQDVLERLRRLEETGTILVPREGDRYI